MSDTSDGTDSESDDTAQSSLQAEFRNAPGETEEDPPPRDGLAGEFDGSATIGGDNPSQAILLQADGPDGTTTITDEKGNKRVVRVSAPVQGVGAGFMEFLTIIFQLLFGDGDDRSQALFHLAATNPNNTYRDPVFKQAITGLGYTEEEAETIGETLADAKEFYDDDDIGNEDNIDERFSRYEEFLKSNPAFKATMKLLREREGYKNHLYKDSRGNLTAGTGHLIKPGDRQYIEGLTGETMEKLQGMSSEELKQFVIPEEKLTEWEIEDSVKAFKAAVSQAAELGIDQSQGPDQQDFIARLTSVNFQLGTAWKDLHPDEKINKRRFVNTWQMIKEARYDEAIAALERSNWNKPVNEGGTPKRVADFIEAIKSLKQIRPTPDTIILTHPQPTDGSATTATPVQP